MDSFFFSGVYQKRELCFCINSFLLIAATIQHVNIVKMQNLCKEICEKEDYNLVSSPPKCRIFGGSG